MEPASVFVMVTKDRIFACQGCIGAACAVAMADDWRTAGIRRAEQRRARTLHLCVDVDVGVAAVLPRNAGTAREPDTRQTDIDQGVI